jgi:deoxyhypusine synthase
MKMLTDNDRPTILLGLAGAVVPGGLRKVIRDMVKLHVVDVLVSTGANLIHDLHEALGYHHYVGDASADDAVLHSLRVDRIYDTYASDQELAQTDLFIGDFVDKLEPRVYSSREFLYLLGRELSDENSIIATSSLENVPIFCPALNDSGIGIGLTFHRMKKPRGENFPIIDPIKDNIEILMIKEQSSKMAAIYVGGGAPKNYIQQVHPMAEIVQLNAQGYAYAIQLTTDDPKWGGLSGCTIEEGKSWGKVAPDAHHATVYMDATIGLPLLFKAIIERKGEWYPRKPINFDFTKGLTPPAPLRPPP